MHKPSPSRLNIIATMAAAMGLQHLPDQLTTAEVFRRQRGPAPKGMKYITGVYLPGGPNPNVEPTKIRNPKVAAQVQMMHEKWLAAKAAGMGLPKLKAEGL